MITYTEKGHGLHKAITLEGYSLINNNGVWESNDDVAVQAIIDSYDPNPYAKQEKIKELKTEGLKRVQLVFPAINDFDELDLVREQYLSIVPAARQATVDFQTMINIVQAGKSAGAAIQALTSNVESYDVVNKPAWPV